MEVQEQVQYHRKVMLERLEKKLVKPYIVEDSSKTSAMEKRAKQPTPATEGKKPPTEEEILAKFKQA